MQSFLSLFFSFSGRVNRARWWIGTSILFVASVCGTLLLDPTVLNIDKELAPVPDWKDTAFQVALVIPGTALTVKRFNDRDRPYWLGFVFGGFGALLTLAPHFGLLIPGQHWSIPELAAIFVLAPAFLFAFVDNGLLRGTGGPNRYGPDPLPSEAHP
jgi:uncharacterized membrane protein YhaH (DUF805 family)